MQIDPFFNNDQQGNMAYKNNQDAQVAKLPDAVKVTFLKDDGTPKATLMVNPHGISVEQVTKETNICAAEILAGRGFTKVFLNVESFKQSSLLDHARKAFKAKGIEVVNYKPQEQKDANKETETPDNTQLNMTNHV